MKITVVLREKTQLCFHVKHNRTRRKVKKHKMWFWVLVFGFPFLFFIFLFLFFQFFSFLSVDLIWFSIIYRFFIFFEKEIRPDLLTCDLVSKISMLQKQGENAHD